MITELKTIDTDDQHFADNKTDINSIHKLEDLGDVLLVGTGWRNVTIQCA